MLKGHTFNLQTFTSEAFALFIDKFLNSRCGVAKGCGLSNTANSATIADGYFVVRGRLLQIISGVTISNITTDGYYSLICEIDLSKTNTADQLNQAEIKVISNASNFPTLTQQDITGSGTVYQYEFARFRVESGSITGFTDRRTYVDYDTLYDYVEQTLQNLENLSSVLLKTGGTMTGKLYANGGIEGNVKGDLDGNANTASSASACTRQCCYSNQVSISKEHCITRSCKWKCQF